MSRFRPSAFLVVGFALVFSGVAIPFLTITKAIPANFFVLFASYLASLIGVILGLLWAAGYVREHRNREK
jgi:cytochrome c biogenesis protein CcdA